MSEDTPQEKAEARAIRRRWITVGEIVAVAGVLIAALSLWMNWSDRRETAAKLDADRAAQTRRGATATLTGKAEDGGERVTLSDPAHPAIASIDIGFPPALGAAAQTSVVPPRIEARWIVDRLLAVTDGGADALRGRLPVVIAATIADGDHPAIDRAIYDLVFETKSRIVGGRSLRLEGVVLRERVRGDAGARIDKLWAAELQRLRAIKG